MGEHEALVDELREVERDVRRAMLLRDPDPFEDLELSLPQLRLLYQVGAFEVASVQQLAEQLEVTAPTVTNLVDRLVQRSLLSRVEDPEDRRRKRITLTNSGQDVVDAFHQHGLSYLMEAIELLTTDELRTLLHLMRRLAEIDAALQSRR